MKTIIVFLLIAVSDSTYNRGTVTVISEYESKHICEQAAKTKERGLSNSFYLECMEIAKEVKE